MVRLMVRVSLCFVLLTCLVGCAEEAAVDRPDTASVSGTVTYNGDPVEGAAVTFSPAGNDGYASIGVTNATGSFTLKSQWGAAGAVPGNYKVTISKSEVGADVELEEEAMGDDDPGESTDAALLPAKYQSTDTSELTAEVKAGGGNNFTFELTD